MTLTCVTIFDVARRTGLLLTQGVETSALSAETQSRAFLLIPAVAHESVYSSQGRGRNLLMQ